ncbi:MAG: YqgE/AlgH family protein [Actinobacteria bacterium]|nr:YqgE/AlgH family protein [Actinomycetota bacterium]
MSGHTGRLLVATPLIGDPHFERTVVLLLAHSPAGAYGVVLNRPTDVPVAEVAPGWVDHATAPAVVFVGGPVDASSMLGLALAGSAEPGDPFAVVVGPARVVDLEQAPDPGDPGPSGVRVFAGSAGWAPGQLDDELADGAWWPVDAEPDDLVVAEPQALWARVLRRQPGEVAWFANHPADPSAN